MIWTARVTNRAADPSAGSDDLDGWLETPWAGWGGAVRRSVATAARLAAEVAVTCAKHRCTDDSAFWRKPMDMGVIGNIYRMESAPSP